MKRDGLDTAFNVQLSSLRDFLFVVESGVPAVGIVAFHLRKRLAASAEEESENSGVMKSNHESGLVIKSKAKRSALEVFRAHPKNVIRCNESHEHARDKRNPEVLLFTAEVHGCHAEAANGHELVAPAEVVPQDVEAFGVQVAPEDNHGAKGEHRNRKEEAVLDRSLFKSGEFCNGKAEASEAGIATRDGKDNHAHDHENRNRSPRNHCRNENAQDLHARSAGQEFRHLVVNEHAACSPDHTDKAFDNHHAVERLAARLLGHFSTCDERALCAVETADDTAGNRHKEHRDDRLTCRMLVEIAHDIAKAEFVEDVQVRDDAHENRERSENQECAENRVDAADNLIDGEEGTDEVVGKNDCDGNPEQCRRNVATRKNRSVHESCRRVGEHCTDEDERHRNECHHKLCRPLAQELAGKSRNIVTVVAHADHAAEVVVYCTAEDVSDREQDEHDGAKLDAKNHADHRTDACDVQKLNENVFPVRHGDAVNAVRVCESRGLAVVGAECAFDELAVGEISEDEDCNTN